MARSPGQVRDAIIGFLKKQQGDAAIAEIHNAVEAELGGEVPKSSVRSYLRLNDPKVFERTARGRYRLRQRGAK